MPRPTLTAAAASSLLRPSRRARIASAWATRPWRRAARSRASVRRLHRDHEIVARRLIREAGRPGGGRDGLRCRCRGLGRGLLQRATGRPDLSAERRSRTSRAVRRRRWRPRPMAGPRWQRARHAGLEPEAGVRRSRPRPSRPLPRPRRRQRYHSRPQRAGRCASPVATGRWPRRALRPGPRRQRGEHRGRTGSPPQQGQTRPMTSAGHGSELLLRGDRRGLDGSGTSRDRRRHGSQELILGDRLPQGGGFACEIRPRQPRGARRDGLLRRHRLPRRHVRPPRRRDPASTSPPRGPVRDAPAVPPVAAPPPPPGWRRPVRRGQPCRRRAPPGRARSPRARRSRWPGSWRHGRAGRGSGP